MATQLENMKYLRSIGASIKLQDDVAKKVGGYESPLFVPTVEFIIKLQSVFSTKSQKQGQAVGNNLPNTFSPDTFKGIDLEEVRAQVKKSELDKKQKKQAVKYVDGMIGQRNSFLDRNPEFDDEKSLIPRRKKDKKQQSKDGGVKKKLGVISFIISAVKSAIEGVARQNAQNKMQADQLQQNQLRNNQRNNRLRTEIRTRDSARKSRLSNLVNVVLNNRHDAQSRHDMVEHADDEILHEQQAVQPQRTAREDFLAKLKDNPQIKDLQAQFQKNGQTLGDKELMALAKQAKNQLTDVSKELNASTMINQVVKNAEAKLEGNKKASLDEVAGKLQNIGIKPINSPDQQIDNKKTLADVQPQTDKQRG